MIGLAFLLRAGTGSAPEEVKIVFNFSRCLLMEASERRISTIYPGILPDFAFNFMLQDCNFML